MRRFIKHLTAGALHYSGLLHLVRRPQPLILMYHRVLPESDRQARYTQESVMVTPDVFDRQMAYLSDCYTVRPLSEVVTMLQGKREIPADTAVVTFDDGWYDNFKHALPVLKKHRIPATVFLTTDFIGTDHMMWFLRAGVILRESGISVQQMADVFEKVKSGLNQNESLQGISRDELMGTSGEMNAVLGLLKRLDGTAIDALLQAMADEVGFSPEDAQSEKWMVDWTDVSRMIDAGVEFGSHGCSHRIMINLSDDELLRELIESKTLIEQKTGRAASIVAYPNGDADERVTGMAKKAGYLAGIITHGRPGFAEGDLYALRRVGVHQGMSVGVSGRFSPAVFAFGLSRLSVARY